MAIGINQLVQDIPWPRPEDAQRDHPELFALALGRLDDLARAQGVFRPAELAALFVGAATWRGGDAMPSGREGDSMPDSDYKTLRRIFAARNVAFRDGEDDDMIEIVHPGAARTLTVRGGAGYGFYCVFFFDEAGMIINYGTWE